MAKSGYARTRISNLSSSINRFCGSTEYRPTDREKEEISITVPATKYNAYIFVETKKLLKMPLHCIEYTPHLQKMQKLHKQKIVERKIEKKNLWSLIDGWIRLNICVP